MASRGVRVVSRCSIFSLDSNWLKNVNITTVEGRDVVKQSEQQQQQQSNGTHNTAHALGEDTKGVLSCRLCGIDSFESLELHHAHYKSDWHKFNLKLKMAGADSVSLQEFESIFQQGETTGGLKTDQEVIFLLDSEESESEDSSDDDLKTTTITKEEDEDTPQNTPNVGSPKIMFTTAEGTRFCVWKRLLLPAKEDVQFADCVGLLRGVKDRSKWTILLSHGGHFAGAVMDKTSCICHKTFHRYTVRKKQGGSQSTRDNKSATSQPKSAGASIRRHNEARLREVHPFCSFV